MQPPCVNEASRRAGCQVSWAPLPGGVPQTSPGCGRRQRGRGESKGERLLLRPGKGPRKGGTQLLHRANGFGWTGLNLKGKHGSLEALQRKTGGCRRTGGHETAFMQNEALCSDEFN